MANTDSAPPMAPHSAEGRRDVPAPIGNAGVPVAVGETSSSAIAAREKAAVEAKFLVALNRPRNPDNARTRLLARCASPRFAEVAEYAKPVGGKKVRGASIRMMEEVARQWQNVDVQSFVFFDDDLKRGLRVIATDLETNYSSAADILIEKTVERRNPRQGDEVLAQRTNSTGDTVYKIRADEDAFLVKQNAAVSKQRRECIRAVVPGDLVEEAMALCAATRAGEITKDPAAARKRIADAFYALGVMPNQLCELLGKSSLEAVTEAEIELLRAVYTAMNEEGSTWAEVVEAHHARAAGAEKPAETPARGTESLRDNLAGKAKGAPAKETPAKASTASDAPAPAATPAATPGEFPCTDCGAAHMPHRAGCQKAKK